ncbi:MAG TPA: hypothetical protein VIW72_02065, partial [Burkholderiales bacterium]
DSIGVNVVGAAGVYGYGDSVGVNVVGAAGVYGYGDSVGVNVVGAAGVYSNSGGRNLCRKAKKKEREDG